MQEKFGDIIGWEVTNFGGRHFFVPSIYVRQHHKWSQRLMCKASSFILNIRILIKKVIVKGGRERASACFVGILRKILFKINMNLLVSD